LRKGLNEEIDRLQKTWEVIKDENNRNNNIRIINEQVSSSSQKDNELDHQQLSNALRTID
jgi:hypothetical protein